MPVLGHAFIGLAFGISTRPPVRGRETPASTEAAATLWVPAMVTLAYLPDIVTQGALLAGWNDGRLLGHSLIFATIASALIGTLLMRIVDISFARGFVCCLASLVIHDVLDLAQATGRAPWWPLSERAVNLGLEFLPTDLLGEGVVFGALFVAVLGLRRAVLPPPPPRRRLRQAWLAPVFLTAIVSAAVMTHRSRDARELQLEAGRILVAQGAYRAALDALEGADRWPSTAKAGRVDYLRAEAYAAIGDRPRAEQHYLQAYAADPTYFWTVADLALFYASSDAPAAERRRQAAPYVNRLRIEFSANPALPRTLTRLNRRLATSEDPGRPSTNDSFGAPNR